MFVFKIFTVNLKYIQLATDPRVYIYTRERITIILFNTLPHMQFNFKNPTNSVESNKLLNAYLDYSN